jgi:hypothetical protein
MNTPVEYPDLALFTETRRDRQEPKDHDRDHHKGDKNPEVEDHELEAGYFESGVGDRDQGNQFPHQAGRGSSLLHIIIEDARKYIRETAERYDVVLVNSNPATIMTDPRMADRTYIEPLTKDFVTKIIKKERPTRFCRHWEAKRGLILHHSLQGMACSKNTALNLSALQ